MNSGMNRLAQAARQKKGISLNPSQTHQVYSQILELLEYGNTLNDALEQIGNMLAAYTNEYGDELLTELLEGSVVEGEIVEQEAFTFGRAGEDDGMDTPQEREEE